MAIKTIITCDVCGEQKKESNHWFLLNVERDFSAIRWEENMEIDRQKHVCSRTCAHLLFENWMTVKR